MLKIVQIGNDPTTFGKILLNPSGYFHQSYFAIGFRDDIAEIYFKHVKSYHSSSAKQIQSLYRIPKTADICFYSCEFVEQIENGLYGLHDCGEIKIIQALTGMLFFFGEYYGAFLAPVFAPPPPVLITGTNIIFGRLKDCYTFSGTVEYFILRRGE